jgi:hypothetical protein
MNIFKSSFQDRCGKLDMNKGAKSKTRVSVEINDNGISAHYSQLEVIRTWTIRGPCEKTVH